MKRFGIDFKIKWPKFIPVIGLVFILIDTSEDGYGWEKAYIYYQVVVCGLLTYIF